MVEDGRNEPDGRKRIIEPTVGGLVWVRRRNGSWWPGQIVGLDELPDHGLASSGSAIPVKLLGRDDAIVELHDLETSKAIKAFRCGDYDSCIEKAKVSGPTSLKRKVRYPRRDIAIICALEIERSRLLKNCPILQSPSNNSDGLLNHANGLAVMSSPGEIGSSSEETDSEEETGACEKSNSTQNLSHSGISYEETNGSSCLKGKTLKGRRKTPNDSEDEGSEGVKRMKGLDDLGLGTERKVRVLALANPLSTASLDNLHAANSASLGNVPNGASTPTLKRKRSQVVHIHELLKRKYRRRPLTKVLENTTMVPVRIICDEFATPFERPDTISPSYECENGKKMKDAEFLSELLPEDESSQMLFDVPFIDEDLHPSGSGFSPVWQPLSPSKPHISREERKEFKVQVSSFGHEALDESGPINSRGTLMNHKMEKSASKWQSKGKRKARHISKTEQPYSGKKSDIDYDKSNAFAMDLEDPGQFSPSSIGLVNGFTDMRNHISLVSSRRSFSYHHSRFSMHAGFDMPDVVPPRGMYSDSSFYEVEVTVEVTRPQAHQVPYISLMSKLNGKPITGHPVAVEVLEDGYCDLQISDYPASGSCELDDDDTEMGCAVEVKPHQTKHIMLRPHFPCKKSSKSKKHGSSSKKTRRLSSLTGPHKQNLEKKKPMVQTPKVPTLACVPLKVVFSRINEALNSSSRSAHRAVPMNNT